MEGVLWGLPARRVAVVELWVGHVVHGRVGVGRRVLIEHTLVPADPQKACRSTKVKASSYIAQYPVLRTVQGALHFISLTDLFTQTPSRLLSEASSHMLQLMREGCSYTYPPLSIVKYSFKQLSELEQCRVKKLAQCFNTAARIRTRVLVVESPKLYP